MRVLLDTCVVVDVLQRREPFYQDAYKVFLAAANCHIDAFLTAKSLTDIYYLTHRSTHDDKQTRKVLSMLLIPFDLLDTAGMDCRKALSSDISDFEDAVMAESALRTNMDCIVTRNKKDYARFPVPVFSPAELLALLETAEE